MLGARKHSAKWLGGVFSGLKSLKRIECDSRRCSLHGRTCEALGDFANLPLSPRMSERMGKYGTQSEWSISSMRQVHHSILWLPCRLRAQLESDIVFPVVDPWLFTLTGFLLRCACKLYTNPRDTESRSIFTTERVLLTQSGSLTVTRKQSSNHYYPITILSLHDMFPHPNIQAVSWSRANDSSRMPRFFDS